MIDDRFYARLGPLSLSELTASLGVDLDAADKSITIIDASALDISASGQITYYGGRSFRDQLAGAKATACFTSEKDAPAVRETGMIALVCKYPRAGFASAISKLYTRTDFQPGQPQISKTAQIDPSARILPGAVIGDRAVIGAGVTIGPNAVIYPSVVIGKGSRIEATATVQCAILGENCLIHSAASIGGDGFGVAATADGTQDIPHVGLVVLGDNVSIGYGTMVDRGMLGNTVIRRGAKIDNLCQIAHNCSIGENTMIAGHTGVAGSVTVGDNVVMGGRVGIADHLTIGNNVRLAASTLLMRDIPDGEFWAGFPGKPIRQYMREVATIAKLAKPKNNTDSS